MYYCSFCCFLKFASVKNFFASVIFFNPLNSLNRVRICAGTPYSEPRDLQKQDHVIARFSCYSTKKKYGHTMSLYEILSSHDFLVICLRCRTVNDIPLHISGLFVLFFVVFLHLSKVNPTGLIIELTNTAE